MKQQNVMLKTFEGNPGTTPERIAECERGLGIKLPRDYVEFMISMNGGAGFIGSHSYAVFWNIEELLPLNRSYEAADALPGGLLFGSDGGGEGFAFGLRSEQVKVVQVPWIVMSWIDAIVIAHSFTGFIDKLSKAQ